MKIQSGEGFPDVSIVIFSNLLAHRSGPIETQGGMRLSLQLRYDDVEDEDYRSAYWPANFKIIDAIAGYSSRADFSDAQK